jgi:anti-sigma factor RsiW
MTDSANHLDATLQDFLDSRLDAARQAEVQAHLEGCARCRGQLEALRWVRDVVLKQLPGEELPPGLAGRIAGALDAADQSVGRARAPAIPVRWGKWAAAVAALAAAIALVLLLARRPQLDLVHAVASDFVEYSTGELTLDLRSSTGEAVESLFTAGGLDFPARVLDLGMMGHELVGGRVHRLRNRPSALFAYQGPQNERVVCQMYPGRLDELPTPHDLREHGGIRFQVYRSGRVTLVFWQEGAVVCVLASDADFEGVIRLAYAKAMKA